ncbi:hypothetical protein LVO79_19090 (plasmid) [Roseivivax marinus]|uniref:hypothetical protein n=1 Tax=Roseivivax marinus TaxID=1379903 RepID=UPI001F0398F7|nr:hypothetical protein [Roseivivax marinus]UMA67116.1 hypothetical protein LVO79_19090 [Roseivivax marinus]
MGTLRTGSTRGILRLVEWGGLQRMNMRGRKVLIVEDDYLQAHEIGTFFHRAGADVLGPAMSIDAALRHAPKADAAILDIDIAGEAVFPVAAALSVRRVPMVFYTGRADAIRIPPEFRSIEIICKPIGPKDVTVAVSRLGGTVREACDAVERMLPLLRAWARILVRDPAGADRLVERTLREAIAAARGGDLPTSREERVNWLFEKCEAVLERDGSSLLS